MYVPTNAANERPATKEMKMGSWGHGAFQNDAALDWWRAADTDHLDLGLADVRSVIEMDGEFGDDDAVARVLAAAELVALSRTRPLLHLPVDAPDIKWFVEHADKAITDADLKKAIAAVDRILASDFAEGWRNPGDERAALKDLRSRLQAALRKN
jgi:hypothetical protein